MVALVVAQIMKGEPIYDTLLQRSLAKNKPQISATDQRHLMELTVASGSVVDGKYIRRITWPNHVVLIDIKRSTGEVLPDFDTRLYAGDYIYVLTDSIEGAQRIRDMVELSEAKNV